MAVRRKEYTFRDGDVIDRIEFHDGNYGAPGKKRKKKKKPTKEDMQKVNSLNKARRARQRINEMLDFEGHAIRNRIWYRGDGNELEQFYGQNREYADKHKFWASNSTKGMEIRKIHTGLPGLIVRTLASVILPDMNEFEFEAPDQEQVWKEIEKDNNFRKKMESALKEALYIGDGAFKVVIDTEISDYPILEWYPGDRVEFVYQRDRIREIVFKTPYKEKGKTYVLNER